MAEIILTENQLKELLKVAIVEVLQEQREIFADFLVEALEDMAMIKAIEEGENTELVNREKIFERLRNTN